MVTVNWLPERLHSVAMRVARADESAYTFGQVALAWSRGAGDAGPLRHRQVERTSGQLEFEVTDVRPEPPVASMLFSEAIHHLRSAVDNVVFLLAEEAQGTPLTDKQARAISMVIEEDPQKFDQKVQDFARKGLLAFDASAVLRGRIASLQPFNDDASVTATSRALARLTGNTDLGAEHPLVLLRSYSNEDKHRSLRVAAAGALVQDEDEWPPREANMKPVAAGQVLGVVPKGTPKILSISAALLVQRPTSERWIAPGPELDAIAAYISDIVIPTLVTGMALPGALPGEVDLTDNGLSLAERLADGGADRALRRSRPGTTAAYFQAMQADVKFAPIVSELDVE